MEVERLSASYDLDIRFAPYLLDPSTPPEGKPRRGMTQPGDPPSQMELRGKELGITFNRGRTWSSNSHIGLQAAEYIADTHPDLANAFHRRMFKAYFDELADIGTVEAVAAFAAEVGVPVQPLIETLESGAIRQQVDDGIDWARQSGIRAVPTFVIDEQYAVVGAQPLEALEQVMEQLGKTRRT